jgi:flagellar capping protein FliD
MDTATSTALISAGSSALVAITALLLNYRGFSSLENRAASLENRFSSFENRFASLETRMDARFNLMQSDMKDFNKALASIESDVARL